MALNPVAYTEKIVGSFLRYQLTAYPFMDEGLRDQMRELLSLDQTRASPLLKGPYVSLSRPFQQGAAVDDLVAEGLLHPLLRERIPETVTHLYSHQEKAIRAIAEGRTTLVSTGTGSGKTECFLYPVVSKCLELRDEDAAPGISAVIVYPMNALAEDQLLRLRGLLAGTGVSFGLYVGKTPEAESDVTGHRLRAGSSRADYEAHLEQARKDAQGETVYPAEEVCSRQVMRTPGSQPRVLLTNVKQLELLLTRRRDIELFADARLDHLVFDEAHTFTGALGAESACLLRRLRAFCSAGPERATCIATSATIVDPTTPDASRHFAARFFGVEPDEVATVGEDYEAEVWADSGSRFMPRAPQAAAAVLDECVGAVEDDDPGGARVQAAYRSLSGEPLPLREGDDWPTALHAALSRNEIVHALNEELAQPRALDELPTALEQRVGRAVPQAEVLSWLALAAAARLHERPLLRPVVHGFVRGIGGAVVSFPDGTTRPKLWLAAEDEAASNGGESDSARFPVATCTTCGQHYFVAFLKDFTFTAAKPGGGNAGAGGPWWERLDEKAGGKRVVLTDRLIGAEESDDDNDVPSRKRTAPLALCRRCGAAHACTEPSCRACGRSGTLVELLAVRQKEDNPGLLTSCLSCRATGRRPSGGRYREPAREVRAVSVADVHVLTQDMVQHAERRRLLVFCDNRQDAAFQAGWMKDHARRFRMRALMSEGLRAGDVSVGDLTGFMDERLDADEALSRALIPEVWQVVRIDGAGVRHRQERQKYLRIQVLREVALSPRQAYGLEPWGRMKVEYDGLSAVDPWIQQHAHELGVPPAKLREGVASVLDYLRRKRALYDSEHEIFTKHWMDGDREVQQGYLPGFFKPNATKLRREPTEKPSQVTQWLSSGDTTMRQIAKKWGVAAESAELFLESLFEYLVAGKFLVPVRLKGARGRPLPGVSAVYQVAAGKLLLNPNKGIWRCRRCRRKFVRDVPHSLCPAWQCTGRLQWIKEDRDDYNLQLLDGDYSMLRPEEHTAMVPPEERDRLENHFKSETETVNCLVCTPTLELGIDIGRLDSVLMRNVPPLPANYWQRAGRAGRRHRMAVNITYCRPVSHDRAYFAEPLKLLGGRIDPPAFNLRNKVMVAKHVHATVIGALYRYSEDRERPDPQRRRIHSVLTTALPRRIKPYLFDGDEVRLTPFDFGPIRELVENHADDLLEDVENVFKQGWPDVDTAVVAREALRDCVCGFADQLEQVVARLRHRLNWAMGQIKRLNREQETRGALEPSDEALRRRCDRLIKRLKGKMSRSWMRAEGHDDSNTFGVLAAEGFLPGYGLDTGTVSGWAEIPFWKSGPKDFRLPRPPAVALREYVPGNLIYANGHRFAARRFHRDATEDRTETATYAVSRKQRAVTQVQSTADTGPGTESLRTIAVCDTDLVHTSHISDEEDLRFQLGVATMGVERDQHSGGRAFRWGSQPVHLRHGVRLRLVNVGPASSLESRRTPLGYPLCGVCGHSVSPFSSERQREKFNQSHEERCGRKPQPMGFHADVVADVLSLPGCGGHATAYTVAEALRLGAARVLDMHIEDLQVLVIAPMRGQAVNALLWDPMPGGSGLLERMCECFSDVLDAARQVVDDCPALCESSCTECLQTFRNAYYHRFLDRKKVAERFETWGRVLAPDHRIPPRQPDRSLTDVGAMPVNDAESKLRNLLSRAGFSEGVRGEQIRLVPGRETTTPDVIYRGLDHDPEEGVCIYLDGLSRHLHGNPDTAERDARIRGWLRNRGYDVIEISVHDLGDGEAMVRHFRRLARYLDMGTKARALRDDLSWFGDAESSAHEVRPHLRLIKPDPTQRYIDCVPFVPLKAAAGAFGEPDTLLDEDEWDWLEFETGRSLQPGMFATRVEGRSMEPRIPSGSYCLFNCDVAGTRQGRVLLVQLLNQADPETGYRFTVKRYGSEKTEDADGWRHFKIVLKPENPEFSPIVITTDDERTVSVVAEFVEVLGIPSAS